jgi:putative ABC transport system substrate-binding protein
MRRRQFIAGLGSAAAAAVVARAQQPALRLVGILDMAGIDQAAFRRGLNESGYVVGRDVAIEYHAVGVEFDRVSGLTADLIRRQVAVIFANGPPVVRKIRAQSTTVPIVFFVGEDPVEEGLVASLNRTGGNITGVTNLQNQLFAKQLGLLAEVVPKARVFGFLVNPDNPNAEPDAKKVQAAARELGVEVRVLTARNEGEFELAFAAMDAQRIGGLLVGVGGATGAGGPERVSALAIRHAIPTMWSSNLAAPAAAGGLMSYGGSVTDAARIAGLYAGRILKGEKPADLPVVQPTKFEFVINMKTAKALGTIPETLLATADEVIQ